MNKKLKNTVLSLAVIAAVIGLGRSCNNTSNRTQSSRDNCKDKSRVVSKVTDKKHGHDVVRKKKSNKLSSVTLHDKLGDREIEITTVQKKDGGYVRTLKFIGQGEYRAETKLVDGEQKLVKITRISEDGTTKTMPLSGVDLYALKGGDYFAFHDGGRLTYSDKAHCMRLEIDGAYREMIEETDADGWHCHNETIFDSKGNITKTFTHEEYTAENGDNIQKYTTNGKTEQVKVTSGNTKSTYNYEDGILTDCTRTQDIEKGRTLTEHFDYDASGNAVLKSYEVETPAYMLIDSNGQERLIPKRTQYFDANGTPQENGASNKQQITPEEMMAFIRQGRKSCNG